MKTRREVLNSLKPAMELNPDNWYAGQTSTKPDGFYTIYVIYCKQYFYIGYTGKILKRLYAHNQSGTGKVAMSILKKLGYTKWNMMILKTHIPTEDEAIKWEDYYQQKHISPYQISLLVDNDYFKKHLMVNV